MLLTYLAHVCVPVGWRVSVSGKNVFATERVRPLRLNYAHCARALLSAGASVLPLSIEKCQSNCLMS